MNPMNEEMAQMMREKFALKLKLEEQIHKNVMEEIVAAAKGKVRLLRTRDSE